MAKILIGELKEVLKQNKKEDIKVVDYHGIQIEIKQSTNVQEKINLVASIFESAINRENGLHILNGNSIDIAFKVLLVQTYTNLTLPKNIVESYDMLVSSGLYDFIYDNIPENERLDLQMALNNHIIFEQDEYEQRNAISDRELRIENVIKEGIDKLLNELTRFIDKLPEKDDWGNIMKDIPQSLDGLFSQIKEGTKQLGKDEQEYLKQLTNTVIGDMANRSIRSGM